VLEERRRYFEVSASRPPLIRRNQGLPRYETWSDCGGFSAAIRFDYSTNNRQRQGQGEAFEWEHSNGSGPMCVIEVCFVL
jgi:hypothetical protein